MSLTTMMISSCMKQSRGLIPLFQTAEHRGQPKSVYTKSINWLIPFLHSSSVHVRLNYSVEIKVQNEIAGFCIQQVLGVFFQNTMKQRVKLRYLIIACHIFYEFSHCAWTKKSHFKITVSCRCLNIKIWLPRRALTS